VFDPFLVKMGPIVVMALFLGLAALAMAPALREVGAALLTRSAPLGRRAWRRVDDELSEVRLWLRRHTPCAVLAGRLSSTAMRSWLRR
jgi:hypothetical protein